MNLAEQCKNLLCFAHVSSTFAVCEQVGFVDEKLHPSTDHDWEAEYAAIGKMSFDEVAAKQSALIGRFPGNYCYTKRMAEELLVKRHDNQRRNGRVIPLVLLRASIMSASLSEPMPGWTDSLGFLGTF